jgi:hypothetical protein
MVVTNENVSFNMIFDQYGLPRDNGATDYMDSARLAGLIELFGSDHVDLMKYVKYNEQGVLVAIRHPQEVPSNNWKNFTRDQLMCLVAGLKKQGHEGTVRKLYYAAMNRDYHAQNIEDDYDGTLKRFPNGADLLTPSHMNHLRICSGEKSTLLGRVWLMIDILFNGYISPKSEPNQLICMCVSAGDWYIRLWKKVNPYWKGAIIDYWYGWRGEKELAMRMIESLEKI